MEIEPLVAGVELGGTKSLILIARGTDILAEWRTPSGDDAGATLHALSRRLAGWIEMHGPIAGLGIASFGPIGLDPAAAHFGHITSTPKPGWGGTDVRGHFADRFAVPIAFDTDVAGAALAEGLWGAAAGLRVHVYLTIGTGIGGGLVVDGRTVNGLVHPEMGHVRVRRVAGDDYAGVCPYHGDCLEGLASGPAIAARAGRPADSLAAGDPVWARVAAEVAEAMAALILTLSPQRILIGGGVGLGAGFPLAAIRRRTAELLAGYVEGVDADALEAIIQPPALGDRAGPLGAVALARQVAGLG